MKKFSFLSSAFVLSFVIVFAACLLLFPLLSEGMLRISPDLYTHLYFDRFALYTVLVSLVTACLISWTCRNLKVSVRSTFLSIQLGVLVCLVLVLYFSSGYLGEAFSRPSYE